jgi:hypothetical protein
MSDNSGLSPKRDIELQDGSCANTIRGKRQAREQGLKTFDEWITLELLVPRRKSVGQCVEDELFYAYFDCEVLISKSEARIVGLKVPETAEPVAYASGTLLNGTHLRCRPLYRFSDCTPRRRRKWLAPKKRDVRVLRTLLMASRAGDNLTATCRSR